MALKVTGGDDRRPRLLDLFCGAGGAAMGYHRAGFEVVGVDLMGAEVLARAGDAPLITRHKIGEGAVIVTLTPRMLGQDERAHPALPYLMNALTDGLLPVDVRLAGGKRLSGEVMYQVNRTKDGYLVLLMNQRGVDKTPNGVASPVEST